jgi:hypothetical protein
MTWEKLLKSGPDGNSLQGEYFTDNLEMIHTLLKNVSEYKAAHKQSGGPSTGNSTMDERLGDWNEAANTSNIHLNEILTLIKKWIKEKQSEAGVE